MKIWGADLEYVFKGLSSNLKTVEIISEFDDYCEGMLHTVETLLRNARVLEKLTVIIEDSGDDFVCEVSRKVLSIRPWASRKAIVELLIRESQG